MAPLVTASDIPAFADFDPGAAGFHCIYLAPSQGRRCHNPVNAGDRGTASRIRERILSSNRSTTGLDDEDLQIYAELCCCVRYHRSQVVGKRIMDQIVQKWQTELLGQRQRRESVSRQRHGHQPVDNTPQRVLQQFTRAHPTGNRNSNDGSSLPTPRFEAYQTHTTVSMLDILSEVLTEQQQKNGSLYCCSRSSDKGFYKHGCSTKRTVTKRVENLQKCSGPTNAVRLEHSVPTANAYRTERLVQHELQRHRRKERRCRDYPNCVTQHKEWFEIDLDSLKRVMSLWAQWMNDANPYDEHGRLREPWKRYCRQLELEGTAITSFKLYRAFQGRLVVDEGDVDDSATDYSSDEEDSSANEPEHQDCPICLEAMSEPARTTCGHEFCSECIAKVFEISNSCPMCRTELVTGEAPRAAAAEIPMQNAAQ
jgi:T5orf172 domain/Ring finger domain